MAIDFPNSPAVNDIFTVGTRSWTWDGTLWNVTPGSLYESVQSLSFSSNVLTHPINTSPISFVATAPTASWTVNFTGADTTNDRAVTASVLVTQGATGYGPTTLQIAGASQTIKWQGGSAPTPTSGAGKIDIYSFTLLRRSGAWTVFGSASANY